MRRFVCIMVILSLLCLCAGCERTSRETVFAMDTVMDLQIWGQDADDALDAVKERVLRQQDLWSATDPQSLLHGEDQTHELFTLTEELSERTGGAFDPQLGAVMEAWGFYNKEYRIPAAEELTLALQQQKWDLGAAVKGYTGDLCVQTLTQYKVDRALLNLGGNVQTYGEKPDGAPWTIGIQNPDGGDPVGTVAFHGAMAVVTSGDYQRYFEQDGVRYHHIIDPETGAPARSGLRSVTVICRDGLTADALSTALFVMGIEEAVAFWRSSADFEAVFITEHGAVCATQGAGFAGCEHEVIER